MGEVKPPTTHADHSTSRPIPISPTHETASFSCGQEALDIWLKATALKAEGRSARTYVVLEGKAVVGYYCLATGSVARVSAPPKIRRNVPDPIPVIIIGRLATAKHRERRGIGGGMLRDAFQRSVQISEAVGCAAVVVHAIDDAAAQFYRRHLFVEFPDGTRTMYLSVETIREAVSEA